MAGKERTETAHGDLHLEGLTKKFAAFTAVDDLDLHIPQGSFFALLGPSGCGKTTTLRMVAGLEEPTAGRIRIGDQDITYAKPYKRPVNTVFQNYALFPHLDIYENVAFGLRRRGVKKDLRKQVDDALELVELGTFAKRRPSQLSGGQQQRVALARAIVNRPEVLLLDEPLGALDLKLRRQMQIELKAIQLEVGLTFVHVTHDQEEAMTMADTIAVMNGGHVEQLGNPVELYESPATLFVANFLGQSNTVTAKVVSRGSELLLEVGRHRLTLPASRCRSDEDVILLGVRPEKMQIARADEEPAGGLNVLRDGVVTDVSFAGVSTQYLVRVPEGQTLIVFAQNVGADVLPLGENVTLSWRPEHSFGLAVDDSGGGRTADATAVAV
jgi:spermidine/putrescine transport system ATP-binding protein